MKTFIKNRKGQKLAVVIKEVPGAKGLAFIMHGLSGNKDQDHIQTFAQAFTEAEYTTVLFDTTNTFGESDGNYENATTTNYYEDLEDVISWASDQSWYQEPFCLAGHSLGGLCISLYAENFPKKVKGLAPISTTVSGQLSIQSKRHAPEVKEWKRTGWKIETSENRPNLIKKLPWSHLEDRLKYDILPKANRLTMPTLLITGEKDTGAMPEHQKLLFDALPGRKEFHIIPGAPHTFVDPKHLAKIKKLFINWIKSLN